MTLPGAGTARTAETTNYEVSKTTTRVLQPPGDVARLSVAVILDDDQVQKKGQDGAATTVRQARKREELQKIQGLVAAAVGFDMERGDQLTVENVSFDEPQVEEDTPPSIFVRYAPQINEFGRLVTVLVIGIRRLPLRRAAAAEGRVGFGRQDAPAQAQLVEVQRPRTVADLESEIEAQIDAQLAEKAGSIGGCRC